MKRLGTDLTSAQKEMKAKHKAYENAVSILSRRLQEALTDKEAAEAELAKVKAQALEGGDTQALQVLLLLLLCSKKPPVLLRFNHKNLLSHFYEGLSSSLNLSTRSLSIILQLELDSYVRLCLNVLYLALLPRRR